MKLPKENAEMKKRAALGENSFTMGWAYEEGPEKELRRSSQKVGGTRRAHFPRYKKDGRTSQSCRW